MKKVFSLSIIFLTIGISSMAQVEEPDWILLQQRNDLEVYYGIGSCGELDMLWLKAINMSDSIAFTHLELEITDGTEVSIQGPIMFHVEPDSTLLINCENMPPHIIERPVIIRNRTQFSCKVITPDVQL